MGNVWFCCWDANRVRYRLRFCRSSKDPSLQFWDTRSRMSCLLDHWYRPYFLFSVIVVTHSMFHPQLLQILVWYSINSIWKSLIFTIQLLCKSRSFSFSYFLGHSFGVSVYTDYAFGSCDPLLVKLLPFFRTSCSQLLKVATSHNIWKL